MPRVLPQLCPNYAPTMRRQIAELLIDSNDNLYNRGCCAGFIKIWHCRQCIVQCLHSLSTIRIHCRLWRSSIVNSVAPGTGGYGTGHYGRGERRIFERGRQ